MRFQVSLFTLQIYNKNNAIPKVSTFETVFLSLFLQMSVMDRFVDDSRLRIQPLLRALQAASEKRLYSHAGTTGYENAFKKSVHESAFVWKGIGS